MATVLSGGGGGVWTDDINISAQTYNEMNRNLMEKILGRQVVKEEQFDAIAWIGENWKLTILGVVALLVLLKD